MKPAARRLLTGVLLASALGLALPALASDWKDLSRRQRAALAPLESEWPRSDATDKAMWLELADRYRRLPAEEQARLQERMREWARLSPRERGQARVQFQEASRWSAAERRERWEAYQSLAPEAREALAERWKLEAAARDKDRRPAAANAAGKRNVYEQPRPSPVPLKAATATTVPARVGATTRPLVRPADEPGIQQHGLPKIAATPSFVDPNTLLPRRGPQGAAVVAQPASASKPSR